MTSSVWLKMYTIIKQEKQALIHHTDIICEVNKHVWHTKREGMNKMRHAFFFLTSSHCTSSFSCWIVWFIENNCILFWNSGKSNEWPCLNHSLSFQPVQNNQTPLRLLQHEITFGLTQTVHCVFIAWFNSSVSHTITQSKCSTAELCKESVDVVMVISDTCGSELIFSLWGVKMPPSGRALYCSFQTGVSLSWSLNL